MRSISTTVLKPLDDMPSAGATKFPAAPEITMSNLPRRSWACFIAVSTELKSRTSAAMPIASKPSSVIVRAAAMIFSWLRLISAILAPARAKCCAMPRLMPLDARDDESGLARQYSFLECVLHGNLRNSTLCLYAITGRALASSPYLIASASLQGICGRLANALDWRTGDAFCNGRLGPAAYRRDCGIMAFLKGFGILAAAVLLIMSMSFGRQARRVPRSMRRRAPR